MLTPQKLYTHANLMFANECLGELSYESTAAAILMAGLFLSFLVEYTGNRLIQWHESKAKAGNVESAGHNDATPTARTDMVNIGVLEAGVIFHSLRKANFQSIFGIFTNLISNRPHPRCRR